MEQPARFMKNKVHVLGERRLPFSLKFSASTSPYNFPHLIDFKFKARCIKSMLKKVLGRTLLKEAPLRHCDRDILR